jgi:hypothetical protein
MAYMQLPNDVVRTYTGILGSMNVSGGIVQNPGATFTGVSSNPALLNIVVNGIDVTANATGKNTVGIPVTFTEAGGLPENAITVSWVSVDDVAPAAVSFITAATFTDVAQPVPSQA